MAMKTVSNLLNIPVKYYALVNMGGLMKLVDYVGGIYVTPPAAATYSGFPFQEGVRQHLNGQAALAYSRMRYDDPQGDYGRQKRQRRSHHQAGPRAGHGRLTDELQQDRQ